LVGHASLKAASRLGLGLIYPCLCRIRAMVVRIESEAFVYEIYGFLLNLNSSLAYQVA